MTLDRYYKVNVKLCTRNFGRSKQNDTLMTKIRSKSKPEVAFQYGSRPFSESGSSSFISACILSHPSPKFYRGVQNLASNFDFALISKRSSISIPK